MGRGADVTEKEWQKRRRAIIDSRAGCECPNVDDRGKLVPARDRCSREVVRCNGVLRVRYDAIDKLGPKPEVTAVLPGGGTK